MPTSTMAGPLAGAVVFLLSSGAAAVSSPVFVAIASFAGETKVDCGKVCKADGGTMTSWSYSSGPSATQYTCGCTGGEILVECATAGFGQAFKECCPAGEGCQPEKQPSKSEKALKKEMEEHPKGEQKLEEEADEIAEEAGFGEGSVDCPPCSGSSDQFTKAEIGQALSLHNKLRNMVGSGSLRWNCKLMCQVQKHADKCAFAHSDSYNSPIPAGENLASGTDMNVAAWMWFSEYGLAPAGQHAEGGGTGHFTALVWKATKELGCGICRSGGGTILCQYANSPPNFATSSTSYEDNVPVFAGTTKDFQSGGFDVAVVQKMLKKFQSWSLPIGNALERFYTASADGSIEPSSQHTASTALTGGIAGGVLAMAVAAAVSAFKRGRGIGQRSPLFMNDLEDADSKFVNE